MDTTALDTLQGELERLFSLDEMKQLSADVLGFSPDQVGTDTSAGGFARALVMYCSEQEALAALVDAIMLSAQDASQDLRGNLSRLQNGELKPGTVVGNLRVVKKLGEGGLSVVYLAEQDSAAGAQQAAIKVIRHEYAKDRSAVQRYTTAARFLQRLGARGIAPILGVGQLDDLRPWVAAEYLQGQSLAERIERSGSLHINEARPIFEDILGALSALHARGLTHGDVKVENVFLVRPEGERETRAILLDACSDRLLVSRGLQGATITGTLPVLGTPKALAPEQARGQEPDARSDLYAFGVLMYETLTGKPPFSGDSAIDVIAGHLSQAAQPPSALARKGWVPEAIDAIVLRALQKQPPERFGSAERLAEALRDAAGKPNKLKPFDEAAFGDARAKLLSDPSDTSALEALEQIALESGGYARVAGALSEAAELAQDDEVRESLLLRAARIYEHELQDALRAESAYGRILERAPGHPAALLGLEAARRETGDHAGLIEILLERIEAAEDGQDRVPLLKEVASIYERKLKDNENACFAYTQALLASPADEEARKGLRRAAGKDDALWTEALTALSETAETLVQGLSTSDDERLAQAEETLAAAQAQAEQYRLHYTGVLEQRREELQQATEQARAEREAAAAEREAQAGEDAQRKAQAIANRAAESAARDEQLQAHEAELAGLEENKAALAARLEQLEEQRAEYAATVEALELQVAERTEALDAAHAAAETKVEAYESLEAEAGETPTEDQVAALNKLADEAEAAVNEADATEQALTALTAELGAAQEQAGLVELDTSNVREQLTAAAEAVAALEAEKAQLEADSFEVDEAVEEDDFEAADIETIGAEEVAEVDESELDDMMAAMDEEPSLTEEEQMMLDAAEAQLTEAQNNLEALRSLDQDGGVARAAQDRGDAVGLYLLIGEYYSEQLRRPDYALPYFTKALELDSKNARAYEGVAGVYRATQAFGDLATVLLQQAAQATSNTAARDLRTEAAYVLTEQLGDHDRAKQLFSEVLAEDPSHPSAQVGLSGILMQEGEYEALHEVLSQRVKTQSGESKLDTLSVLAQLEEEHLGQPEAALAHYSAVMEEDADNEEALRGVERLAEQLGDHQSLIKSLTAQAKRDLTPKQRIGLWARIGQLQQDEFVDHAAAAESFERIREIDPRHIGAISALVELYRNLGRFEECAKLLEVQAERTDDTEQKFRLLLDAARIHATELGDHEEAILLCERILASDSRNSDALAQIAELRSAAGDLTRAVEAVEQLAEQAEPGAARAEQLLAAGKMAEQAKDGDAAVMRYKRALDEDPNCVEAAERLRVIYAERGDTHGTVEMLKRAVQATSGTLKRAQLLADLGVLQLDELSDEDAARASFVQALELEPTNTLANVGLGKLALEDGDHEKAASYFDVAMGRLDELDEEAAADISALAGDAFSQVERHEDAVEAFKRVCTLRPAALSAHERHASAVADSGNPEEAIDLYSDVLSAFESRLSDGDTARILLARGALELASERTEAAVETFKRANSVQPSPEALAALTQAQEQAGNYQEVVNLLQHRTSRAADEDERFALLVKTGDVFLERLHDRDAAVQTYSLALDERPDDRNLLTKLMAIYSDAGEWPRLIEVILRIAEMVDQPEQLAKYYNTAATIAHRELGRYDEAANYYEESLAQLPADGGNAQFQGLRECLTENQDWDRLEQAYQTRLSRKQAAGAEPQVLAELLDQRAELVRDRLGRTADALALFEAAQELDPHNAERSEMLKAIYTREPKRYFDRAVAAHRMALDAEPGNLEALRALRRIYTSGRRPDESFGICQALRVMGAADEDEEKFFKKYRLTRLPKFKHPLDEPLFRSLVQHAEQEPSLTAIFTTLTPAILAVQSQPLAAFGVSSELRVQPEHDSTAMGRMIAHVGDATAVRLPDVFHCPHDAGGLSFLFSNPPAVGIGQGAAAGGPQQALAFIAGRHLSYYRPGAFARQLVPTGTGLRAWLMASIRLVVPHFGVPENLEGQVSECLTAIRDHLTGPQKDSLRSLTQKLLEAAPELDMRRYIRGVDFTADRSGFVLSNDLKVSLAVIDASPEDSASISRADRAQALLAYATSEAYFELRKRLGIALGG